MLLFPLLSASAFIIISRIVHIILWPDNSYFSVKLFIKSRISSTGTTIHCWKHCRIVGTVYKWIGKYCLPQASLHQEGRVSQHWQSYQDCSNNVLGQSIRIIFFECTLHYYHTFSFSSVSSNLKLFSVAVFRNHSVSVQVKGVTTPAITSANELSEILNPELQSLSVYFAQKTSEKVVRVTVGKNIAKTKYDELE